MSDKNIIIGSISNHNNSLLPLENKKNNNSSLIEKFYWITPTSFDEVKPFNFKQAPWSITFIFLFSVVIIPTILSLLRAYFFKSENFRNITQYLFKLVPLTGFIFSIVIRPKIMLKSGAWIAYNFCFVDCFLAIFTLILSDSLPKNSIWSMQSIINGWEKEDINSSIFDAMVYGLLLLIAPLVLLCTNKEVQKRIIYTFKENSMLIISVVIFYFLFSHLFTIFINFFPRSNDTASLLPTLATKNQEGLNKLKATPWGFFVYFFLTCFAAPISEEFSCRFGIFTICRTPWLGFIVSTFYFAAMHVMRAGDWEGIISYLPIGFILSLLYINTRGNIVYPIFLHWLANFHITISGLVWMLIVKI